MYHSFANPDLSFEKSDRFEYNNKAIFLDVFRYALTSLLIVKVYNKNVTVNGKLSILVLKGEKSCR